MPEAADYDNIKQKWCGLRPASADGLPIVSKAKYDNLYVNTGHGMLGWTYSLATAELARDLVLEKYNPDFDINTLSLSRFRF
ncbi:MAG: FAD-dependent oxidoreductase [Gammaproteobacteria bacterium]|nr:FAD-dependent oxidoreductase [Gammaproteobacteria bacterium]